MLNCLPVTHLFLLLLTKSLVTIYKAFLRPLIDYGDIIYDQPQNKYIKIRSSESITLFKRRLLFFIVPVQYNIYNIFDPKGLKFLTRLRLGLSHLNAHRFQHHFQDCLNPLCSCSLETEDTSHYLLHCHHFSNHCAHLMNSVISVGDNFESMSDNVKKNVLLYGDSGLDEA